MDTVSHGHYSDPSIYTQMGHINFWVFKHEILYEVKPEHHLQKRVVCGVGFPVTWQATFCTITKYFTRENRVGAGERATVIATFIKW